ncbi:peptidoglycan-binding protein [Alkalisalibacterium limincola]|uniref:Peptidoglycan-binding protein n=1 Tax=Alkalisalibacterium limincola TaxID=2699169 RepID=A0A5C8KUK1_9GAMM|nr:peptidoglycan-binding protein [Alkalisalibacterium limincola]
MGGGGDTGGDPAGVLVLAAQHGARVRRHRPGRQRRHRHHACPQRALPRCRALDLRLAETRATEASAWNRLLALWLLRADEVDAEQAAQCPPEIIPGIYCLRSRGNLDKLAAIGRPVIVPLRGESGTSWAVLLGVDVLRVRLGMGGDSFDIDRRQLERIWNGDFVALWKAQPWLDLPLRRGDRGPGMDWLHTQLLGSGQLAPLVGPAQYDDDVVAAVRRLQTAHGLQPDGILGLETLLALTGEGEDGPLLRRRL